MIPFKSFSFVYAFFDVITNEFGSYLNIGVMCSTLYDADGNTENPYLVGADKI